MELYASSNGDRWLLIEDVASGQWIVMHEPNWASGGKRSYYEIDQFLSQPQQGPEHQALKRLLDEETQPVSGPAGVPPSISRPAAVAFDIIQTVFSLDTLQPLLRKHQFPDDVLELWFARTLRDAFALSATTTFAPFSAVAEAALHEIGTENGLSIDDAAVAEILAGFANLRPHGDAIAAFKLFNQAGIPILALSNGAAATTRKLLDSAGLSPYVSQVFSIDDIGIWKPSAGIYRHAATVAAVEPRRLAMIATHAWDLHGAKHAGLMTCFVARGQRFPSYVVSIGNDA